MMNNFITIFCNFPDEDEAKCVSTMLLSQHLVSCANMVRGQSFYSWDGETKNREEIYVSYKTTAEKYTAVEVLIKEQHSYEVPCIIVHDIEKGSSDFLDWIRCETSK